MILHLGVNLGIVSIGTDIPIPNLLRKTKANGNTKEYTKV